MESKRQPTPLKRLKYFSGRLLSADDLITEQEYFREKLKRHNRFMHGSGMVIGLLVSIEDDRVSVSPGLALDCSGEEIAVSQPVQIGPPEEGNTAFLMIQYVERQTDGIPRPEAEDPGQDAPEALYIEESFELSYNHDDPYMSHGEDPLIWTPCGRSHPIPLAKLIKRRDAWEVDPWFQAPIITA